MPMTLGEFLRQWPAGRLMAGIVCSLVIHGLLVATVLVGGLSGRVVVPKRGDALFVELPSPEEPASRSQSVASAVEPAPARPAPTPPPPPSPPPSARPTPPTPKPAPPVAKPAPPAERPALARSAQPAPAPPAPSAPVEKAPAAPAPVTEPTAPSPPPAEAPRVASTPPPARTEETVPSPPAAEARLSGPPAEGPRVAVVPPGTGTVPAPPDVRSALRRGRAREGIEGDPIPLDSPDPRFRDYLLRVKRQIEAKMWFPCIKGSPASECEYKPAKLIVEFGIRKDGTLAFVELRHASPYKLMDDASQDAVKLASPFPPIPDAMSRTGIPIMAIFSYETAVSFRWLIR